MLSEASQDVRAQEASWTDGERQLDRKIQPLLSWLHCCLTHRALGNAQLRGFLLLRVLLRF